MKLDRNAWGQEQFLFKISKASMQNGKKLQTYYYVNSSPHLHSVSQIFSKLNSKPYWGCIIATGALLHQSSKHLEGQIHSRQNLRPKQPHPCAFRGLKCPPQSYYITSQSHAVRFNYTHQNIPASGRSAWRWCVGLLFVRPRAHFGGGGNATVWSPRSGALKCGEFLFFFQKVTIKKN